MSERDDFGAFLIGFIVGGLTGAVAALLLAPQSGEDTRKVIKDKAIDITGKASETIEETYTKAEKAVVEAQERLSELAETTKERADELQSRGKVLLEEQREKLGSALSKPEQEEIQEVEIPGPEEGEEPAEASA